MITFIKFFNVCTLKYMVNDCDIDNPIKLKETIKNAMENPNYYLEGNVFTADAPDIISNYYNTLINNIKIKLNV